MVGKPEEGANDGAVSQSESKSEKIGKKQFRVDWLSDTVAGYICGAFSAILLVLGAALLNGHPKPFVTGWTLICFGIIFSGGATCFGLKVHRKKQLKYKMPLCMPMAAFILIAFIGVGVYGYALWQEKPERVLQGDSPVHSAREGTNQTKNIGSIGPVFNNSPGNNSSYNQAGRDINVFELKNKVQRGPAFKIQPPDQCVFFHVSAPSIDTNLNNRLGVLAFRLVIANNLDKATTLKDVALTYGPQDDRKEVAPTALPARRIPYGDEPTLYIMPVRSGAVENHDFPFWEEVQRVLREKQEKVPGAVWHCSASFIFGEDVKSPDDIIDPHIVVRDYLGHAEEIVISPKGTNFVIQTDPTDQRGARIVLRNNNSPITPHIEPIFSPVEAQSGSAAWWVDESNQLQWMTSRGMGINRDGLLNGDMCLKFDATSFNDLKLRIAGIYVQVLDFKRRDVFGRFEHGHLNARKYIAEIQPTNGIYLAKPASTNQDEYDFLAKNETEYFSIGVKCSTPGICRLRVLMDYVVGTTKFNIEVGDAPETIGFYKTIADPPDLPRAMTSR